jgi:hypothetical protein
MTRGFKAPQPGVYLQAGDVWKYGTTVNPLTRYSQSFLNRYNLRYTTDTVGNVGHTLSSERNKILGYLQQAGSLPPGNKIIR